MATWGLSKENIKKALDAGHVWTEGTGIDNPAQCKSCNCAIENCTFFYKTNTKESFRSNPLMHDNRIDQDKEVYRAVPKFEEKYPEESKVSSVKNTLDLERAEKKGFNDALDIVIKIASYKFGPLHSFMIVLNALKGN